MELLAQSTRIPPTRHPIHGLNPLVNLLNQKGINPSPLLGRAGVAASVLNDPAHHLTSEQELNFTRDAIEALNQPDCGLIIGGNYHLSAYGTLGLAIMTCETLLDAMKVLFENILMTWTYMHWSVSTRNGMAILTLGPMRDLGNCYQYMIDRGLIASYLIFREALGTSLPLREVNIMQSEPVYADRYRALFNCPINFSAASNNYIFDKHHLNRPLPQSDPNSNIIYRAQCEETSHGLQHEFSYKDFIRQHMFALENHQSSLQIIAEKLHTTPRTIQRKLAAEGARYQELLENVRCNLAIEYLKSSDLSVDNIALRLGYSDAPAFCHAFKRWTGKPPRDFRH